MVIKIEQWLISSSGRSVNIFTEEAKYYMPLKKIGLTSNDVVPNFDDAEIHLKSVDLFKSEMTKEWIRINKFEKIVFSDGRKLTWDDSNKIKKEVFGSKEKNNVKYEYIDPTKF